MIRRLFILSLIGFLFLNADNYDTNAKIKAIYIFNFANYIEWPKEYRDETFVIGVIGDTPLMKELERMSSSKKIFNQSIVVKQFESASNISKCHILYVPHDCTDPITGVLGSINDYSTLLVTDKPGLALQGSAINFVVRQNRVKFELNEKNAVKHNLKVSNSLEALAILVN